jgi:propionyl-CoA synthetase
MTKYAEFHRRSIADRDGFWREEAKFVDWHKPFERVLDYSRPPFAKWFVGGETNLCHNAVDRHLADSRRPWSGSPRKWTRSRAFPIRRFLKK